jgi:hypothetical protein
VRDLGKETALPAFAGFAAAMTVFGVYLAGAPVERAREERAPAGAVGTPAP